MTNGLCLDTPSSHREGLAGLAERSRTGRRPGFPPALVVAVKAIACELPARLGLPLSRRHVPEIRAEVIRRGLVASLSDATIWRWLSEDAIKPWTHRSWIFPHDTRFRSEGGARPRPVCRRVGPSPAE
jgi:hypothetical protein